MARTRESLFVFKQDGTWRVNGTSPASISVLEFDRSLVINGPQCVCETGNRIYAWSNYGLVEIDESGWRPMSDLVVESELEDGVLQFRGVDGDDELGPTLRALSAHDYLILGYANASTDKFPDALYAYSLKTNDWSKWAPEDSQVWTMVAQEDETRTAYQIGRGDSNTSGDETQPFLAPARGRSDPAGTRVSLDGTILAVTALGGDQYNITADIISEGEAKWLPECGDAAIVGSVRMVVTTEISVSRATVVADGTVVTGSVVGYKPFTCTWRSRPKGAQNVGVVKEWLDITPAFSRLSLAKLKVGTQSDINDVTAVVSINRVSVDTTDMHRKIRTSLSRDHAYASEITPRIVIQDAYGGWRLKALSLTYRPVSTRVDSID